MNDLLNFLLLELVILKKSFLMHNRDLAFIELLGFFIRFCPNNGIFLSKEGQIESPCILVMR